MVLFRLLSIVFKAGNDKCDVNYFNYTTKFDMIKEQQKSKKLEESMKKLDTEMKRTDQLLYQMIPKAVADRLRQGEPAMNTCQVDANLRADNCQAARPVPRSASHTKLGIINIPFATFFLAKLNYLLRYVYTA